tara:strand:+ start:460 stop:1077 length:618 start_codon:yes stop_codon:yes gene_type:complete
MTSQIVYALSNPAMPGLIKIGKTTQEDVSNRMSQLYSTGVPVPFECIYAVQVDDCTKVEKALHIAFGPYRINPNREFFKIEDEQAIAILKLLGPNDATEEINRELDKNISQAEQESGEKLKKRPNMNFHEMGIETGELLSFGDDDSITVEINNERKVKYNGEVMSLTKATRTILDLDYAIQPSPKWKYNGRLLCDIYEETYSDED